MTVLIYLVLVLFDLFLSLSIILYDNKRIECSGYIKAIATSVIYDTISYYVSL